MILDQHSKKKQIVFVHLVNNTKLRVQVLGWDEFGILALHANSREYFPWSAVVSVALDPDNSATA